MKWLAQQLTILFVLPLALHCQTNDAVLKNVENQVPWVSGISAGFSLWPSSKERLRLGYSWELQPNRHLLHELTYVSAEQSVLFPSAQYGNLEGIQLRNEVRFYRPYEKRLVLYYSLGLAYMYAKHRYSFVEGVNCNAMGECDYFQRYRYLVPTHTTTLQGNVGILLAANRWFHIDFFTGLGLRSTYFPLIRTDGYFGKYKVLASSESTVLEPHLRLGLNLLFVLQTRKDSVQGLQNP